MNLQNYSHCQTIGEFQCISKEKSKYYPKSDIGYPDPCISLEYTGTVVKEKEKYSSNALMWNYGFVSHNMPVYEEYYLYDSTDIIGLIGGTLGMFIGFSIFDTIMAILSQIRSLFRKISN